jgi:ATP-dependent DNA helicase RecG
MIPELIRKQIRQGEGIGTEFKVDVRNLEPIAKTVCAFLNTLGGTVFCGVDDKGKIVGMDAARDQMHQIHAYYWRM